mmetsp:Transcript_269/g.656  ORF Transcript_269/g.656 Transcript_269/m.656 type:complete len:245 (-) Transcript_269:181-915(-)
MGPGATSSLRRSASANVRLTRIIATRWQEGSAQSSRLRTRAAPCPIATARLFSTGIETLLRTRRARYWPGLPRSLRVRKERSAGTSFPSAVDIRSSRLWRFSPSDREKSARSAELTSSELVSGAPRFSINSGTMPIVGEQFDGPWSLDGGDPWGDELPGDSTVLTVLLVCSLGDLLLIQPFFFFFFLLVDGVMGDDDPDIVTAVSAESGDAGVFIPFTESSDEFIGDAMEDDPLDFFLKRPMVS